MLDASGDIKIQVQKAKSQERKQQISIIQLQRLLKILFCDIYSKFIELQSIFL